MDAPPNQSPPPLPGTVSVRYRLTKGDLFRWQVYQIIRNRVLLGLFILCSTFLVVSDLSQPDMAGRSVGFKCFFVVFFAPLFGGIVFLLSLVPLGLMVAFRSHRGLVGEHLLEVTEAGLIERTDVNESLHRWTGFHKLISTRKYFYIFVTDAIVHVVPKRAFDSENEARVFQTAIERRAARANPAAHKPCQRGTP